MKERLTSMDLTRFEQSMILMGVNWNRAAKTKAFKDIRRETPRLAEVIKHLDSFYRKN